MCVLGVNAEEGRNIKGIVRESADGTTPTR